MKLILKNPKVWFTVLLLSSAVTSYGQEQPAKRKPLRLSANAGFFNEWADPMDMDSDVSTPNHGQFIGASLDCFFVGRWFSRFGLHLERVVEDDLGRKKEGSFVTHKFSVTNRGTRKSFGYLSSFLAFGRSFNIKKVEVSPYIGVSTIPRPKLTSYHTTANERIETGVTEASLDFPGHLFASGTFDPYIGTDISLPVGENKRLGLRFQFVPADQPRVDFGLSFSHNFPSKFYDFLAKHKTNPSQLLSSPQFFFSMGAGYMKEYKNDGGVDQGFTPNSAMIYSFTGGVMNRKRWFFQFSYDLEDTREKDLNKNFLLRALHFSVGKEFQWNQQKVRFFTGTSSIKDIGSSWRKQRVPSKPVLVVSPQKIANLFYLLGLEVSTPLYRELHIGLRTKWITDFSYFGRTDLSAFLTYTL